jgi:hypothetical protein
MAERRYSAIIGYLLDSSVTSCHPPATLPSEMRFAISIGQGNKPPHKNEKATEGDES